MMTLTKRHALHLLHLVLNRDSLLATMAVFPKRLHLCGEGPGELVERSLVRL